MTILPYGGIRLSATRSGEVQARLPHSRGQEEGDGGELQQRHEPRQRRRGPQRAGRRPRPQGDGESQEAVRVELLQPVLVVDLPQRVWR